MSQNRLIVLEGIDGSGKSTQALLLQHFLDTRQIPSVIIKAKEKHQDRVFSEFVESFGLSVDSPGYMFLYQALHRRQFEKARDALSENKVVIADRWNPSFHVYHNLFGVLSKKPKRLIKELDHLAFENLEPGVCIFLDVPVEIAFERRIRRNEAHNFSSEEKKFYERITDQYRQMTAHGSRWVRLDGTGSIEDVHHMITKLTISTIMAE